MKYFNNPKTLNDWINLLIGTPTKANGTKPLPSKPKTTTPPPKVNQIERKDSEKEFLNLFKQLTYRHRAWEVWKDFITMFACAISNSVDKVNFKEREDLYMKIIKKYSKEEQAVFPELAACTVMALDNNLEQDFLGHIFMALNLGNQNAGQFFTPYDVCKLMATISVSDVISQVKEDGYITLNDCACGAGATLIAGINEAKYQLEKEGLNFQNHILVTAQDIDYTTGLMCYIQLSLIGVAGYVKIGDSLMEPMSSKDNKKDYWTTPMYFSNVWIIRRMFKKGGEL